jgi:hypothetical protein
VTHSAENDAPFDHPSDEPTAAELAEWLRQGRNGPRIAGPAVALAMEQTEALARAWEEGWNAAVDSDGYPGDRNPYRPIPPGRG